MNSNLSKLKENKLQFVSINLMVVSLLNSFKQFEDIDEVIIFGSRVKRVGRTGSDIDFAIVGDKLNFNNLMDIHLKIDDLSLLYTVDLVDFEKQKGTNLGK